MLLTIAIAIRISDGIVLASDSASTVSAGNGQGVMNVFNNANKIFNLCKTLPVGLMNWGLGQIGNRLFESIAKDYRKKLKSDLEDKKKKLTIDNYQINDIAQDFTKYILTLYTKQYGKLPQKRMPSLGFTVCGYSAGKDDHEQYYMMIHEGKLIGPNQQTGWGIKWDGEREPITRLLMGYSEKFPPIISSHVGQKEVDKIMNQAHSTLQGQLVFPYMPLQDAIDLGEFLVDFVINFSKFKPGANTVGGPIEIAAITKHEGFKWIKRKHYYSDKNNINF